MRLAIISNAASSLLNFRGPLIRAMVERGHEVFAFAPDYNADTLEAIKSMRAKPVDYNLYRTGLNPIKDLESFFNLFLHLRRIRPDVSLAYTIKPVIYGTFAAWLAKVPKRYALITGLGYIFIFSDKKDTLRFRFLRGVGQRLYQLALSKASIIFFQNKDDFNEFVEGRIVAKNKAFLLGPTGVDLKYFCPTPPFEEPITFLMAGRLLREKGVIEFVHAARRVKRKYPDTRFVLLGGVDANPGSIKEEDVKAWLAEKIIEWPGHVSDVRPWIARASVFVLPSYREGVPRSVQEAMAMGRPVITTDVPGCREAVITGVNGFVVPPLNVGALVSAMENFINEPSLIEKMGRESRRLAEERFDVHKINKILLDAMEL